MENEDTVYQIFVDPAANDRMFDHFEFMAKVSELAASRLLDEMLKDILSLETLPYRNPEFNRPYLPQGKYRYMITSKRYRIIYQIEDNSVFIVRDVAELYGVETKDINRVVKNNPNKFPDCYTIDSCRHATFNALITNRECDKKKSK